ncbi:reverse transcriptase domain-containing protein [Qipengyuania mesophila]
MSFPRGQKPISPGELCKWAHACKPWLAAAEPAEIWWIKKDIGERPIFDFAPERRAAQWLAARIIEAAMGASPFEFARKGGGPNLALVKLREAIQTKGGPRWFSIIDIKDCYRSISRNGIYALLPLPRSVIDNTIFLPTKEEHLITTSSPNAVPIRIPQGSLASNIVAAKVMQSILEGLSGFPKMVHGDDLLIGSMNETEALAVSGAALKLCKEHPAGPLKVKLQVTKFGRLFDYLGYRVRKQPKDFGGGVRLTPSAKSFERFQRRMFERLVKARPGEFDTTERGYREQWMDSFPLWDRSEMGDELVEIEIAAHVIPAARKLRKSLYGLVN